MEMVNETLEQVEQLAQLMAQHGATRVELRDGALQIALTRAQGASAPPTPDEEMPPLFVSGYTPTEPAPEAEPESLWQPPARLEVRSECVGYCTLAPIPVGASVERGQTLATVEVLGIANEVVAPLPAILEAGLSNRGSPCSTGNPSPTCAP
jgi:biotin carboxyl carrier protein